MALAASPGEDLLLVALSSARLLSLDIGRLDALQVLWCLWHRPDISWWAEIISLVIQSDHCVLHGTVDKELHFSRAVSWQAATFALDGPAWQADEDSFAEVLPAMHAGAVTGVDCAVRRPLAATVGADHAIRLWNHADRCAWALSGRVSNQPWVYHLNTGPCRWVHMDRCASSSAVLHMRSPSAE